MTASRQISACRAACLCRLSLSREPAGAGLQPTRREKKLAASSRQRCHSYSAPHKDVKHECAENRCPGPRVNVGQGQSWSLSTCWAGAAHCACCGNCVESPLTFRAFQAACDTNPGSLNTRLKKLRELGIVDHDAGGYQLTGVGRTLIAALQPLQAWADEWAAGQAAVDGA